ncbi:MAG TPA: hypothetical protein VD828_01255 [Candidatus Nitrosotenuis sp.]|nr:hypothetical protein [Candidatus Nitrosotenuis sp.]
MIEAGVTTVWILNSLKKLEKNPSDKNEIENLLNHVDVVMGDAKFLGNKQLEESAKMIISLFNGDKVTSQKSLQIRSLIEQFKPLIQ